MFVSIRSQMASALIVFPNQSSIDQKALGYLADRPRRQANAAGDDVQSRWPFRNDPKVLLLRWSEPNFVKFVEITGTQQMLFRDRVFAFTTGATATSLQQPQSQSRCAP